MADKYKKLFGYINLIEPPKGLRGRILAKIEVEEKRIVVIKTWVFGSTAFTSLGLSLWAVIYLVKNATQSGFWQYLSLIFSENSAIFAYWREFSLSLAQSLPITSLIMFLTATGFFIWSFTKVIKIDNKKFITNFN